MNLYLLTYPQSEGTPGDLVIDHRIFCHTLEDKVRQDPRDFVPGDTAVKADRYRIDLTMSKRFERVLPILVGVQNHEGVRFHGGNTIADTAMCILVAYERSSDGLTIWNKSGGPKAIDDLVELLKKEKENWVEIIRAWPYRAIPKL